MLSEKTIAEQRAGAVSLAINRLGELDDHLHMVTRNLRFHITKRPLGYDLVLTVVHKDELRFPLDAYEVARSGTMYLPPMLRSSIELLAELREGRCLNLDSYFGTYLVR